MAGGGGKMIWDSPGSYGAEAARLRKRVAELEAQLMEQREEYRKAIEQVAGAHDELQARFEDHLEAHRGKHD